MSFFSRIWKSRGLQILLMQMLGVMVYTIMTETDLTFLDPYYIFKADKSTVKYQSQVDSVLNQFKKVPFQSLNPAFKASSGMNLNPQAYKSLIFYEIERADLPKKLANHFSVRDFVSKDLLSTGYKSKNHPIYLLVDKKLIYKTLELCDSLNAKGYNDKGFEIVAAHRNPSQNNTVKGPPKSRDLKGQALDIRIRDINKDGQINQADKKIVLDLLEDRIIKDKGGVGRYVGTLSIHFDVRGTKARWDSYSRN